MIYHLEQTTSTNDDARDVRYREGDIIRADRQTAGRGQRGHRWESRTGENLTFSLVLEPSFLPAAEQFLLSESAALALVELFEDHGIDARIKWTNDIYVGSKKIVGILIEHIYSGAKLARTIIGIGINVNQCRFDESLPNPTSMRLLTGKEYDLDELLEQYSRLVMRRYEELKQGVLSASDEQPAATAATAGQTSSDEQPAADIKERIRQEYISKMYHLGERHPYRLPDGSTTYGTIRGVRHSGELIIDHDGGNRREYLFKEIEFVLEK